MQIWRCGIFAVSECKRGTLALAGNLVRVAVTRPLHRVAKRGIAQKVYQWQQKGFEQSETGQYEVVKGRPQARNEDAQQGEDL